MHFHSNRLHSELWLLLGIRQGLRVGTNASTTVTKEALRWGFWHFGDFSRAYKDCFGELPLDTLRRPPVAGEST